MSKIAFIADVHAQRSAWANRPIEGDTAFAFKQVAEICKANDVEVVAGLGDLKERPVTKSYDDGLWLDFLLELQCANIGFVYVQGNHDKSDPPCLWNYPGAEHIHGKEYEISSAGETLYGLDYQDGDSLQAALDAVPDDVTILCCHQRWGEFMGSATNPQGSLKSVRGENLWLVASGDLHETIEKDIQPDVGGALTFLSPGSLTMQSIVEDPDKYVFLLDERELTRVKLKSRTVLRSPMLNARGELEEFLEAIPHRIQKAIEAATADDMPPELQTPILHVRFSHKLDDCVRRVTRLVGNAAHLFWKEAPPDEEESDAKVAVIAKGEAVTPLGLLRHIVDPDVEPEVHAIMTRGLSSAGKDAMRASVTEFCEAYLGGDDVD